MISGANDRKSKTFNPQASPDIASIEKYGIAQASVKRRMRVCRHCTHTCLRVLQARMCPTHTRAHRHAHGHVRRHVSLGKCTGVRACGRAGRRAGGQVRKQGCKNAFFLAGGGQAARRFRPRSVEGERLKCQKCAATCEAYGTPDRRSCGGGGIKEKQYRLWQRLKLQPSRGGMVM